MENDLKSRLIAISLLDGRNYDKTKIIPEYFSEFALIKYRLRVEIAYLIFLSENTKLIRKLTKKEVNTLALFWKNFSLDEAIRVKEIEKEINHDMKAVEYFLRKRMSKTSLSDLQEFIHFGLTSYDINIPSYALMLCEFRSKVLIPKIKLLSEKLRKLIYKTENMVMLGRTHGQPALPTTMGKELAVFYSRIIKETEILQNAPIEAKLTGAVGNFNSFVYAAPEIDWIKLSKKFIRSLSLKPNIITTQIIPYDSWLYLFDSMRRLNNILLGLSKDIWWYICFEYFRQKKKEKEVGSSTMSHKINPITFENAEGNLGVANSLFEFFVKKLSYSRLQRDLSDSTVKRDFGLAFGFSLLAWDSLLSGLDRISPNSLKMKQDLSENWEIFSEGIQTYLKVRGYHDSYDLLRKKTRGQTLTKEKLYRLIDSLPIKKKDKEKLKINNLSDYLGLAKKIARIAIEE